MKYRSLLIIILAFFGCKQTNSQYVNLHQVAIQKFQDDLNNEYKNPQTSPLTKEDLAIFKSLEFFPFDDTYKVTASFERTPNEPIFEMKTTTDRKPLYKRFGIATFKLNGKEIKLNVYQNQELIMTVEYRNYLFIPFLDPTNGKESYKGGRYIDLEIPKDSSLVIDFNQAYNPYCAYNSNYSCPVVPSENYIDLPIKAGVKAFGKH